MKQTKLPIIGSRTLVDFPRVGILQLPAKVDTGAYSSSIWASNIKETDGELSFRLLDRESPFFNGRTIKTKEFEMRLVKNSFGQTEFRYRVTLGIRIEGIRLRARFTLADRSNNRYPILIGRKTLQSRFLVDVTKRAPVKKPLAAPRILVLVNSGGPKITKFYQQINTRSQQVVRTDLRKYRDLTLKIEDGTMRMRLGLDGRDVGEYDLVYFMTFMKNLELAALTAAYAKQHNVPLVDTAVQQAPASDKLHQYGLLAMYGLRVPDSWYMPLELLQQNYAAIKDFLKIPFVLKDVNGKKGRYNYLITNKREFMTACAEAAAAGSGIIQVRDSLVYRALVLDNEVKLLIRRTGDKTVSHLNNTAAGGKAEHLPVSELSGAVQKMCIDAATTLQWQVAGVDIVQDKATREWYCLEVNNSPQLVSGAFVDKKQEALLAFLLEEVER